MPSGPHFSELRAENLQTQGPQVWLGKVEWREAKFLCKKLYYGLSNVITALWQLLIFSIDKDERIDTHQSRKQHASAPLKSAAPMNL